MSARYFIARRRYVCVSRPICRSYATGTAQKPKSAHSEMYSNTIPAMIPVFLLGSAVYLGLQLVQSKLAHERFMEDAIRQVAQLEAEIDTLQEQRLNQNKEVSPITPISIDSKPSRWRLW